jgi:glycosyltransferase involved in cell wall biosynthesis
LMLNENRPKFIFTEHSTHNRRREKGFFRFLDEFVYASYDRIISVSDKVQKNLKDWLNSKHDSRFVTIYNGIDLDLFKSVLPYEKHQLSPVFRGC